MFQSHGQGYRFSLAQTPVRERINEPGRVDWQKLCPQNSLCHPGTGEVNREDANFEWLPSPSPFWKIAHRGQLLSYPEPQLTLHTLGFLI